MMHGQKKHQIIVYPFKIRSLNPLIYSAKYMEFCRNEILECGKSTCPSATPNFTIHNIWDLNIYFANFPFSVSC